MVNIQSKNVDDDDNVGRGSNLSNVYRERNDSNRSASDKIIWSAFGSR